MCIRDRSIWVQRLAVEAAVAGDVNLLKQAALMDPLTGAVCNPPEIWQMIDEMLIAQEEWLPQYKDCILYTSLRQLHGVHPVQSPRSSPYSPLRTGLFSFPKTGHSGKAPPQAGW